MDPTLDLKRDLSMGIEEDLNKHLLPGESIIISLPGGFGEAFVVSDKRAIVIREQESGINPVANVYAYPLGKVTGAAAVASGTGGYIELKLSEPAADQDAVRVYFPSYDLNVFEGAGEYIAQLVASRSQPTAAAPSTSVSANERSCPKCGAAVEKRSVFCSGCGEQLLRLCAQCGSASPSGVEFCDQCGREFVEQTVSCAKCGARVRSFMIYCTECGSIQRTSCAQCGAMVIESWKYCTYCGRLLGSGVINPRTSAARHLRERLDQVDEIPEPPKAAEDASVTPTSRTAEEHNQCGRELFDSGDTKGAIREFQAAIVMDPSNASYHCNLAIAYDDSDEDMKAFDEYAKTLDLDPSDLTALLSLGYMYSENDEPGKAEAVWNKILQVAPDSAEAQEVKENLRHREQL